MYACAEEDNAIDDLAMLIYWGAFFAGKYHIFSIKTGCKTGGLLRGPRCVTMYSRHSPESNSFSHYRENRKHYFENDKRLFCSFFPIFDTNKSFSGIPSPLQCL